MKRSGRIWRVCLVALSLALMLGVFLYHPPVVPQSAGFSSHGSDLLGTGVSPYLATVLTSPGTTPTAGTTTQGNSSNLYLIIDIALVGIIAFVVFVILFRRWRTPLPESSQGGWDW